MTIEYSAFIGVHTSWTIDICYITRTCTTEITSPELHAAKGNGRRGWKDLVAALCAEMHEEEWVSK